MAMEEESSGAWLQRMLMRVCCEENAQGIQLDSDTVSSLVSYCELAAPADAAEYLTNIVGYESCMEIVEEYLKRRATPPRKIKTETGVSLQAYQKPQVDNTRSLAGKNTSKPPKQRTPASEPAKTSSSSSAAASSSTKTQGTKAGRGKRNAKQVSVAEASKMVLFPQGKACDCQATRHELINNCLSCGKIVCQQEGEGPCNFCGALVLREGSSYAGLDGNAMPTSDAEATAQAFKDRLVEFDRNSASRTTVIDDQSDFFDIEGDAWASEEEKQLLRKKQEAFEKAEEERKKRVVVTIDLLGRKVVMAGGDEEETANGSILLPDKEKPFRVKASPDARELPVYVNTVAGRERSKPSTANMAITGRVQHEDSFNETLINRKMELLQIDGAQHEWLKPKLMPGSSAFEEASQNFECA